MNTIYSLGLTAPTKTQLLSIVEIIRAEELFRKDTSTQQTARARKSHHATNNDSTFVSGRMSSKFPQNGDDHSVPAKPNPMAPPSALEKKTLCATRSFDTLSPLQQMMQCDTSTLRSFLSTFRPRQRRLSLSTSFLAHAQKIRELAAEKEERDEEAPKSSAACRQLDLSCGSSASNPIHIEDISSDSPGPAPTTENTPAHCSDTLSDVSVQGGLPKAQKRAPAQPSQETGPNATRTPAALPPLATHTNTEIAPNAFPPAALPNASPPAALPNATHSPTLSSSPPVVTATIPTLPRLSVGRTNNVTFAATPILPDIAVSLAIVEGSPSPTRAMDTASKTEQGHETDSDSCASATHSPTAASTENSSDLPFCQPASGDSDTQASPKARSGTATKSSSFSFAPISPSNSEGGAAQALLDLQASPTAAAERRQKEHAHDSGPAPMHFDFASSGRGEHEDAAAADTINSSAHSSAEDNVMEGVTVERVRNWFKNRRYAVKKRKDRASTRRSVPQNA